MNIIEFPLNPLTRLRQQERECLTRLAKCENRADRMLLRLVQIELNRLEKAA